MLKLPSSGAVLLGAAVVFGHGLGPAEAREIQGTAVAVIQATDAVGPEGPRSLATRGPVYMNDRIATAATGEAQILFKDDTRLVVGPNSSVSIDDYVVRGNKTTVVNAVTGAFRFVGGAVARKKESYAIRTPTATIGIRGTKFDFAIGPDGSTSLAMIEGAAQMCDDNRRCVSLSGGCSMAVVSPGGGVRPVTSAQERAAILRANFPYVRSQSGLRQDFRINVGLCGNLGLGPVLPGTAPVVTVPPTNPAPVAPSAPAATVIAPPAVATPPAVTAPPAAVAPPAVAAPPAPVAVPQPVGPSSPPGPAPGTNPAGNIAGGTAGGLVNNPAGVLNQGGLGPPGRR